MEKIKVNCPWYKTVQCYYSPDEGQNNSCGCGHADGIIQVEPVEKMITIEEAKVIADDAINKCDTCPTNCKTSLRCLSDIKQAIAKAFEEKK